MTIPTMVSIKEASRQTGISYEFIRQLIRERKIIYVRAGVKFLVNMESLVEYLSTGEQHDSAADQEQELFNLVNKRMEHGKITIYTSNMDANALNVDARTRDRIIKTSIVLQMPEENLRKKKAAADQQSFLQMILQQQGR